MEIKKIAAAALAAAMTLSCGSYSLSMCVSASEESTSSADSTKEAKALQAAILDVKGRVKIPANLTEFTYDTDTRYGTAFYSFQWYREEEREGYNGKKTKYTAESVSVNYFKGYIASYSYYSEKSSGYGKAKFAKLTPEKQLEFAEKYLKQLNPGMKGNAVVERQTSASALTSKYVNFSVKRVENGINMPKNNGSITIDRDTGKLISFSLSWWSDADILPTKGMLTESEISAKYEKRKGLEAYYEIFDNYDYDQENGEYVRHTFALPVYVPSVPGENELDAFTGEPTAIYADKKKYSYTDAYDWAGYDGEEMYDEEAECDDDFEDYEEPALTDAELAAVSTENSYISYDDALKIIKDDKFIVFNDNLVSASKNLYDYNDIKGDTRKKWSLWFKYSSSKPTEDSLTLYVDMDAETGEILSFNKYITYGRDSSNLNTTQVDHKSALSAANKALSHFMGKKAGEFKYSRCTPIYKDSIEQTLYFTRYVNGLEVPDDIVTIRVDSRSETLGFSYTYHDIEFPDANLVSKESAYKNLFEKMKPELYYDGFTDLQLKPHIYLTYRFDSDYMINALTGERVNYRGESYYKDENPVTEKEVAYTDISGYKYENEINTLLAYGIYVTEDSELKPDDEITIGEFLMLTRSALNVNLDYDYRGKTDAETEEIRARRMTRGELLKLYVSRFSGNASAAKMTGIYKSFYSDIPDTDDLCGYAAIGRYMGYISQKDGKFDPDKGITKGEALKKVYDYLSQDKEKKLYEIFVL